MQANESTNPDSQHDMSLRNTDFYRRSAWNEFDGNGGVSSALLNRVSQGALVLDSLGRILSCNERFANMVGIPAPAIVRSSLDNYLSPRHTAAVRSLPVLEDVLCETESDLALRRADGSVIPIRVSVTALATDDGGNENVGAFFTDCRDVNALQAKIVALTDQVNHEVDRRKTAEARLQRVHESNDAATWECEPASGRVTYGVGLDRVLNLPPDTAWSVQAIVNAFAETDREAIAIAFVQAEVAGAIDIEGRLAGPEVAGRWIRLQGTVIAGPIRRLAGFAIDITTAHEDRERLRHANAMEAVGQIAVGIAHDLNNFLQVIGNSLELLARRTAGDAQIARLSGAAQHALLRAAKLSQQLLTFSRGQELQLERVSFDEHMPSIRSLLDRVLPDSVSLHVEPMTAVWPCVTDLYQLEAVMLNLAINARDAMADGGVLEIGIEDRQIGAGCASSWGVLPGEYVMIRVSDTGTGMTPDVAARAFEPFFTTKAPGKGTGLGLSQVYTFAKRCSGFVTIESAVGHGSRVLLFLPRSE